MITEVCGMIRALKANNLAGAESYARLLAENLDKVGQHKESSRVRRALGEQTLQAAQATLDNER
jgi:phenylacetate-coenzyme A ligase PaaK-like adenylate-forming protein